jgi:hypothetical protein
MAVAVGCVCILLYILGEVVNGKMELPVAELFHGQQA